MPCTQAGRQGNQGTLSLPGARVLVERPDHCRKNCINSSIFLPFGGEVWVFGGDSLLFGFVEVVLSPSSIRWWSLGLWWRLFSSDLRKWFFVLLLPFGGGVWGFWWRFPSLRVCGDGSFSFFNSWWSGQWGRVSFWWRCSLRVRGSSSLFGEPA